jgi:Yip1 domain
VLVFQSPGAVFAGLRDDSDEAAEARQEPIVAIVFLAGVAGMLSTTAAGRLLDDGEFDAILVAVWAVFFGAVYGLFVYFAFGALVYASANAAASTSSYRQARHLVAFSAAPIALSLLLWPGRIALYGGDVFRRGGSDSGTGDAVFDIVFAGCLAWSVALLAIGMRVLNGWTWGRTLAAVAVPAAVPALALARAYGLV